MTGRLVWIPAIMVYLHLPHAAPGERWWSPVSTGTAVHTDYHAALVSALCETVERDAIALTWLQKLPLPGIELDSVPVLLAPYMERASRTPWVRTHLFDATTDIGIPTVYGVHVAAHDPKCATIVTASTELDPARAIGKVLREAAAVRVAMRHQEPTVTDPDRFTNVWDGALYTGAPRHAHTFEFLLAGRPSVGLSALPRYSFDSSRDELAFVLGRLAGRGMEAYAVDLTTDEAERAGMCGVRVVVPDLQPLSFVHRAQYRGHRRLYQAPQDMGHPSRAEADLNTWPQPFA
jgi:ribosomal protein S12 methylthiotransferase accessory factor